MSRPIYLGIDLGTTNSAAAVFDGERLEMAQSAHGGFLTPSIVRADARGNLTVGSRARRFLEKDPENTLAGFKRLMGTGKQLLLPASGRSFSPQELSAEVLKVLLADLEQQIGFRPSRAVVAVPALFEVPQSAATAEAARLAGLERVELLQEPVASALASGWQADAAGSWLVYDLGGGTFDVSLLEGRDGLLRVVGHDGDNFLGGRDLDRAIVDWALAEIEATSGRKIRRDLPAHAAILRQLAAAAEETKIELSRQRQANFGNGLEIEVDGDTLEVDFMLDRLAFENLCTPLIERSLMICERLLRSHGLSAQDLAKVVLVGGPTAMPFLRQRVAARLAEVVEGLDPMALVAQGAALFAASAGLDARVEKVMSAQAAPAIRPVKLWLQHPAMASGHISHIIGKVVEKTPGETPFAIEVTRVSSNGVEAATAYQLDAEGAFVAEVELRPQQINRFALGARTVDGRRLAIEPAEVQIIHGLTLGDPPLSRTIGVALANNEVQVYFERGVALPARRMFVHRTIEALGAGSSLKIPIVQGDFDEAHLCRVIGGLELDGSVIERLPIGSEIEVTLEVGRGGELQARAFVPRLDRVFEKVIHLRIPDADPAGLTKEAQAFERRLAERLPLADEDERMMLIGLDARLLEALRAIESARGGDEDGAQRARRLLLDLEAELAQVEENAKWPEIDLEVQDAVLSASRWVELFGSETEKRLLQAATSGVERAVRTRSPTLLRQHRQALKRLTNTCYFRHPEVWSWELDSYAALTEQATDPRAALQLIERGRAARNANDDEGLRQAVRSLWPLFPASERERILSYGSGIR